MKRRGTRANLITDAARSQEDQLRTRTVRYVLLMSVRVVSLLVAALLVMLRPPLLGLWLAICAIGMILIPWMAVMLANDRLPKEEHRWRRYRTGEQSPPAVTGGPPAAADPPRGRVIDADDDGTDGRSAGSP